MSEDLNSSFKKMYDYIFQNFSIFFIQFSNKIFYSIILEVLFNIIYNNIDILSIFIIKRY